MYMMLNVFEHVVHNCYWLEAKVSSLTVFLHVAATGFMVCRKNMDTVTVDLSNILTSQFIWTCFGQFDSTILYRDVVLIDIFK